METTDETLTDYMISNVDLLTHKVCFSTCGYPDFLNCWFKHENDYVMISLLRKILNN